ncbi:phosphatase [bacterium]|nr:phosphatase [bacterium]
MLQASLKKLQSILVLLCLSLATAYADTIDHYVNIANNIPKMEMKADPQAQAWARSARNVLILTSESVAESLTLANETATHQGSPLFCLPQGITLNGRMLNDLIQQTYRDISSQESDKNKMTVSQVALIGISKQYPCQANKQALLGRTAQPTVTF